MRMRDNLEGLALHAAQNIEELHPLVDLARPYLEKVDNCPELDDLLMFPLVRAHALRELCMNIKSVKAGLEPMSEFAAFYCFIADESLSVEVFEKIGFVHRLSDYIGIMQDERFLGFNPGSDKWVYRDSNHNLATIKTPENVSQLWLLAECLGFKLNWKALES